MPSISVRGVDQHTLDELKRIAASNGRSVQAELRALLKQFAALPWESRLADYPLPMLPLPSWYTDLADVRMDFVGLTTDPLPPRRSPFRMLTVQALSLTQNPRVDISGRAESAA